jgi:ferredoxin
VIALIANAVTVGVRCTACGACLATCPEGALVPAPRRPRVDGARCTACLECVEVCPAGAIDPAVVA